MEYLKKQFAAETAILEAICLFDIHSSISHHIKDIKMSMCQYCIMRNDRLRFSSILSPKNRCYCWMEGDFAFQFAGMMYWRTIYSVDLLICHFENVAFSLILTLEIAYSEKSCLNSLMVSSLFCVESFSLSLICLFLSRRFSTSEEKRSFFRFLIVVLPRFFRARPSILCSHLL